MERQPEVGAVGAARPTARRPAATAVTLLIALIAAGCGTSHPAPKTDLTLLAINATVGRAEFRLSCGPAGGNIAHPAKACSTITADPSLITDPQPFTCIGGTFSWWDITITGHLEARKVDTHVSTCWTPQMAMIQRLGIGKWQTLRAHLLPIKREAIRFGTSHTYPPGDLQPGDRITCDAPGHDLEDGIPDGAQGSTAGWGNSAHMVTLSVTRRGDGSVIAICRRSRPQR